MSKNNKQLLKVKQKELDAMLHEAFEAQQKADKLRDEVKFLYGQTLPDEIKKGVYLTAENEYGNETSTLRVDFIDIYVDDFAPLSHITVHGYGITKRNNEPDVVIFSNDTVGLIRNGDMKEHYKIISEEEYDSIMAEAEETVKKPMTDWSKYKH